MKNVTRPGRNPALTLFLRIMVIVALVLIAIKLAGFLLTIVAIAAVVAALAVGGLFLYNFVRARANSPTIR